MDGDFDSGAFDLNAFDEDAWDFEGDAPPPATPPTVSAVLDFFQKVSATLEF